MLIPGQIELDKLSEKALEKISGEPQEDILLWTKQLEPNSCAVNAQCFVINSLKDTRIPEAEMIRKARELRIYDDNGTVPADVGKLAEAYGLECERIENGTLEQIEAIQNAGGKVIAGISCIKLAYPQMFGFFRADHAVQVIGVDRNDPENVRVLLNDPGRDDGRGLSVPAYIFLDSWKTSKNFMTAIYPEITGDGMLAEREVQPHKEAVRMRQEK